jgi:hypothetical protein
MTQYVRIVDEEEGIGTVQALAILSANEHRNTSHWRLVEELHFKNGKQSEVQLFVVNHYDKPDEFFEPVKMLVFEAKAIAKSYVMEEVESQMADPFDGDEEEYDDED